MALPAFVPKAVVIAGVAVKIDAEPVLFVRAFALRLHLFKGEKAAADVVEHAVQDDADARLVKFFDQALEIFVVAQPPVYLEKIDGIVPVALAFKQRVEQHGIEAALLDVRDALFDDMEAMAHLPEVVFAFRPAVSERIDLIKDAFVKPHDAIKPPL